MRPALSVLMVAWNNVEELSASLPAVLAELSDDDELIVVDNASSDGTAETVERLAPRARLVRNRENTGFARGCNDAASLATGDLLVVMNSDVAPLEGFGAGIRKPWLEGRRWEAWQALITEGIGRSISSAGNPIHFTGVAWGGLHARPVTDAPGAGEVPTMSGACFAVRRQAWLRVGGFPSQFFLYQEDVDLSFGLRLAGGRIGIEPAARIDHDYEFRSTDRKWRWLERNRWSVLIRNYPGPLLLLLLPSLIATDLAILAFAASDGWARHKIGANREVLRRLPRLLRERRAIQASRKVTPAEFAEHLTADLDSPFLPDLVRSAPARALLRGHWWLVRRLLRG